MRVCPDAESVALTCRLAAVPMVQDWLPGFATVTVLPVAALTVQVKVTDPGARWCRWRSPSTVEVPAAVGVPLISPVPELTDRPAGRPVAE